MSSRLLVVTRPELADGFSLAGVEVFPAVDVESAVELITGWLENGESGLLAIDESILSRMDRGFLQRVDSAEEILFLGIPSGEGLGEAVYQRNRIAELTRRAIGFHSIFKTEKPEEESK